VDPEVPRTEKQSKAEGLDHQEVLAILRRRRLLMGATFLVVMALVAAVTFLLPPTYEARSGLTVTQSSGSSQITALASGLAPASSMMNLAPSSLDAQQWMVLNPPSLLQAAREAGQRWKLKDMLKQVNVSQVGGSLMVIAVDDHDPRRATDLANAIARLSEKQNDDIAKQVARDSLRSVVQEMDQMQAKAFKSAEAVRDYKLAHGIVELDAEVQARVGLLGQLHTLRASNEAERQGAQRSADYYWQQLAKQTKQRVTSATLSRNPLLASLDVQLAGLEADRARMTATRGPAHPDVHKLDQQISQIKSDMAKAVADLLTAQVNSDNPQYVDLVHNLALTEALARADHAKDEALKSVIDGEMGKLQIVPKQQVELGRLTAEANATGNVYSDVMKNYYLTKLQLLETLASVRFTMPATPPDKPIKPNVVLNMAVGVLMGVVLALLAVLAAEMFIDPVRSARDAGTELAAPALGSLPNLRGGVPSVTSEEAPPPALADAIGALHNALRLAVPGGLPGKLLVTGCGRGEGKTTVAAQLAAACARSGLATLLVDANVRRPAVHEQLSVPGEPGLAALLEGAGQPSDFIQATAIPNLKTLPAGTPLASPVELLGADRVRGVLDAVRGQFDVVLVDAPEWPNGEVLALAAACDGVMMVVQPGSTRRRAIRQALDQLSRAGRRPLGFVANRV